MYALSGYLYVYARAGISLRPVLGYCHSPQPSQRWPEIQNLSRARDELDEPTRGSWQWGGGEGRTTTTTTRLTVNADLESLPLPTNDDRTRPSKPLALVRAFTKPYG